MQKLKNIRFNLRFFNGSDEPESVHSVKELEEKLRNNQIAFDDFMAYFFSGQLERWLECHGEKDLVLLDKLHAIDKKSTNKEIVIKLFAALGFCFDEQEIDRMIVSYDFPCRLKAEAVKNAKDAAARHSSMRDELDAYTTVCKQILAGKNDLQLVRKLTRKIVVNYLPILELDAYRFFRMMHNPIYGCPAAIIEMIINENSRKLFVTNEQENDDAFVANRYDKLQHIPLRGWLKFSRTPTSFYIKISNKKISNKDADWPGQIDVVTDYSDAEVDWKTLVPKGQKVLVLCNDGVSVKDGKGDKLWGPMDMTNQFIILDGCSYKQIFKTRSIFAYVGL